MGVTDRDWYREDAIKRRAKAETSARPGWRAIEKGADQVCSSSPCRRATARRRGRRMSLIMPVLVCLMAGALAAYSLSRVPIDVPEMLHRPVRADSLQADHVTFPQNGAVVFAEGLNAVSLAPLSIQTPPGPRRQRFVILVRDWVTGASVAKLYLYGNSITTIMLPAGQYRLMFVFGIVWEGDDTLFGRATEVFQQQHSFMLMTFTDHAVGERVSLMPTTGGSMPVERIPQAAFLNP